MVVFDNTEDRIGSFESIELDDNYQVRFPSGVEQFKIWQAFSPVIVDKLANYHRLNIYKQRNLLVIMRFSGCSQGAEVDELVELATWFVKRLNPKGAQTGL